MYFEFFTRFASATFVSPSPKEIDWYPCEQYRQTDRAVGRILIDGAGGDKPLCRDEQKDHKVADLQRIARSFQDIVSSRTILSKRKQAGRGEAEENRINRDDVVENLLVLAGCGNHNRKHTLKSHRYDRNSRARMKPPDALK